MECKVCLNGSKCEVEERCFVAEINACPPHATVSIRGRRNKMEDAATVAPSFATLPCAESGVAVPLHFFGVYDGHGSAKAALFCKERLHTALAEAARAALCDHRLGMKPWQQAMNSSFHRMDQELYFYPEAEAAVLADPLTVGTTAVIAVIGYNQIAVANCGDSRAVLSRGGKAIPLSCDHKPDREDEMQRIKASGGHIIYWDGYRVMGVLAMSRAIGDQFMKPFIIPDPEVVCVDCCTDDECLILASDGLWDVLSNEMVCEVARKCLAAVRRRQHQRQSQKKHTSCQDGAHECSIDNTCQCEEGKVVESPTAIAAALLTKLALARGSNDNITVIVIDLNSKPFE